MSKKALRRKQVEEKTGRSTSWLYEAMAQGKFPRPIRDGRSVRWLESEIDEWLDKLVAERDRQQSEAACG
jgi:prophage regulatory protein